MITEVGILRKLKPSAKFPAAVALFGIGTCTQPQLMILFAVLCLNWQVMYQVRVFFNFTVATFTPRSSNITPDRFTPLGFRYSTQSHVIIYLVIYLVWPHQEMCRHKPDAAIELDESSMIHKKAHLVIPGLCLLPVEFIDGTRRDTIFCQHVPSVDNPFRKEIFP